MFFRSRFNAIAECLDARYKGATRNGQNPADKGELCEVILREALSPLFGSDYSLFRGGKIIDSTGQESSQFDIILTSRQGIPAFEEKGIYPIETVYGAVHVTSTLTSKKLKEDVESTKSIPKASARFSKHMGPLIDWNEHETVFRERLPYKVIFAFRGVVTDADLEWLENEAGKGAETKQTLPDLIVVNRTVVIEKVTSVDAVGVGGQPITSHFAKFNLTAEPGIFITLMANELHKFATWIGFVGPDYVPYFNADLKAQFEASDASSMDAGDRTG
jgi:hypothetical protein